MPCTPILEKLTVWWRVSNINRFVVTLYRKVSLEFRTTTLLGGYDKIRLCVCIHTVMYGWGEFAPLKAVVLLTLSE